MTIALTSEQLRWLQEQVAAGRFASLDEGVQAAVVGLMNSLDAPVTNADEARIGPLLDAARRSLASGEGLSLDEFKAHAARRRTRRG